MAGGGVIAKAIYNETAATATMREVPRFGHSSNFADIFATEEDKQDYIAGLLFAGIFLFALFFAWSLILLILKCVGQRRVGFLAGGPLTQPSQSESRTPARCGPKSARSIFVISTIIVIVFSVLFVTNGLTNLRNTVVTVVQSSKNFNEVVSDVDTIKTNLKSVAVNTTQLKNEFLQALTNGGDVCVNEAAANQTAGLNDLIVTLQTGLTGMGNFTVNDTAGFDNTVDVLLSTSSDVTDSAENISLGDWQALVILIPYILVPCLLLVGVALAWIDVDIPQVRCVLSNFILPIFIIMVVFAYSFACGILIAASANADFCSGGAQQNPDVTVVQILQNLGNDPDTLVMKVVRYYIGQCVSDDPFAFLSYFAEDLRDVRENITNFATATAEVVNETLSSVCVDDVALLNSLAEQLSDNLKILFGSAVQALNLLQCSNIVSLYTVPVYSGTCTYSINGVTWAFASFTVVGVAGLTMIMLRSAWQLDMPPDFVFDGTQSYGMEKGEDGNYVEGEDGQEHPDYETYNADPDEKNDGAENTRREYAPDGSTNAGEDVHEDDEWMQSEFTVPPDVHLEDNDTVQTDSFNAGGRKPQHYASPY